MYEVELSDNFRLWEFITSATAIEKNIKEQYNVPIKVVENITELVSHTLQPLREAVGKIIITSGYRSKELNKAVQGVSNSQHLVGEAADIRCSDIKKAIYVLRYLPFDQLIMYDTFLHISFSKKVLRKQIIDNRI